MTIEKKGSLIYVWSWFRNIHYTPAIITIQGDCMQQENAFTGMEAAIVLIGFMVTAAVFALAVTSSGFFVSEESKDVSVAGMKQASSAVYLEGAVYATLDGDKKLDTVEFSAGILETGQPQDLSKMLIVYTHSISDEIRPYEYGGVGGADGGHFGVERGPVMNPGDKQVFTLEQVGGPTPGGSFTIELKPQLGASTFISYHIPVEYTGGVIRF